MQVWKHEGFQTSTVSMCPGRGDKRREQKKQKRALLECQRSRMSNQLNHDTQRPKSGTHGGRSRPVSALTNTTSDADYEEEDDDDIEEIERKIQIEDRHPPVSPRDKLSYQEDRKAWKEFNRFNEDHPELDWFVMLMQTAIFRDKPKDIVHYLVNDFFADHNQIKLRQELGI
jgi:hypothetical protein